MWPNSQDTADLVTLTEEILNAKLYFMSSVISTCVILNGVPLSLQWNSKIIIKTIALTAF